MIVEAIVCLAMNIYYEARSEPLVGQIAVAHVVLNRVNSDGFPKDVCSVVKEKKTLFQREDFGVVKTQVCQFSWVCNSRFTPPRNSPDWQRSLRVAALVLDGVTADPTRGAHFFHAANIRNPWRSVERTVRINNHIFYRKRNI